MNQLICDAINERKVIEFDYDEHKRIVQPHAYGIHKDTRNEVLRAFQIRGYSSSGNVPDWRLYILSKISNIKVLNEIFETPAPKYRKNDSAMSHIYCQI